LPSFDEELARMEWLKANHKVAGTEPVKVIFPRLEAKKRVKNTEGRTRLIVQLDTAQTYSDFAGEFSRYKECAGNVQVAFQLMLDVLRALPDESIARMAHAESTEIT